MSDRSTPASSVELDVWRLIAGWLVLLAVLLLALAGLERPWTARQGVALALPLAGLLGAWRYLRAGAPGWLALGGLAVAAALGLFGAALISAPPPDQLPLLQIAIVLTGLATLLTALLSGLGLVRPVNATLLSLALGLALFLGETGIRLFAPPPAGDDPVPIWSGRTEPHPELGMTYVPHSQIVSYYPSNPRGYFKPEDPRAREWHLELQRGTVARMELPPAAPEVVRVTITETHTDTVWLVQLERRHLRVTAKPGYSVRFRARADQPRRIVVALAQSGPSWSNLGLYREVELTPEWKNFQEDFAVTQDDPNARIHFNLAGSLIPVEFAGAALYGPDGSEVPQQLPPSRFVVNYEFNDQGCRGRDYPLERGPGTLRILLLGDSYTLGTGVHEHDTFAARLERLLAATDSGAAALIPEVINCGVSGYGTREERIFYQEIGARYRPDIVVLAMVFNDDLSWHEELRRGLAGRPPGRVARMSRLGRSIRNLGAQRPFEYAKLVEEVLQLDRAVRAHGARLLVSSFGSNWDPELDELTRTVRDGLRGTDIPVLDLNRVLRASHRPEELKAHPLDGHLNDVGHRVVAEELRRFLRDQGWVPE
jgi:hypothetical protein